MLSVGEESCILAMIGDNYSSCEHLSITSTNRLVRAWEPGCKRSVVVKIPILNAASSNSVEFLRREAAALDILKDNPGVVQLLDSVFTTDRNSFVILEYVDGYNLHQLLDRETFSLEECVDIGKRILKILSSIHKQDLYHCDLKPENIMLTGSGDVKVIDFGLVRFGSSVNGNAELNRLITANQSVYFGTPWYVSPEQAMGSTLADCRCDIYVLGVILHELLVGVSPFGKFADVRFWEYPHFNPFPKRFLAKIPSNLREVVLKALASSPDERYQSADEMLCALEKAA